MQGASILAAAAEVGLVGDLAVVLTASAFMALLMRRLGLAVIPAFLLAGVALGPHALALVPSPGQLGAIADLAIIVLLFGIGLELHLASLRGSVVQLVVIGLTACVLCVVGGWPVALAFGLDAPRALLASSALALSSTAIVLKQLAARRELALPAGRLAVAVLVVQDLAVVAMLGFLPLLAQAAGVEATAAGGFRDGLDVLLHLGAVVGLFAAARLLVPRLLGEALRSGGQELLLLLGVAFAFGAAWATHALGFSLEMGAFLAGFLLSGTRFRHELGGQVVPIRDFFLAMFFTVLGMQLDPGVVAAEWPLVLAGTAAVLLTKSLMISLSCWAIGAHASVAVAVGVTLSQAGEFSLVLLGAGSAMGLLDARLGAVLIAVVVATLVATPALSVLGHALGRRLVGLGTAPWTRRSRLGQPHGEALAAERTGPHVVIAGFGPVGRRVAQALAREDLSHAVIDLNARTIRELEQQGRMAVLGDARSGPVLIEAGIEYAQAFVSTIPDDEAAQGACTLARRLGPDLVIAVRAERERVVGGLRASGADHVVVDELAAADQMANEVMLACGRPPSA